MSDYREKTEKLHKLLQKLTRSDLAVAFSGGVDSSLLLKLACMHSQENQTKVYAYTAVTQLHPAVDLELAKQVAGEIGAEHIVLEIQELYQAGIENNPENRCYLCKKKIFQTMLEDMAERNIAETEVTETDDTGRNVSERKIPLLIEGSNMDDTKVYRPGLKAIAELGIRSPLMEAGLSKEEVRRLATELQISTADRPSTPCMATRFPYGTKLTMENLKKVEQAEAFLGTFGFRNIRLRVHDKVARIEIDDIYFEKLLVHRNEITRYLKELGFDYITLDLEGFCSGSMDKRIIQKSH